jgi:hypothetical protein
MIARGGPLLIEHSLTSEITCFYFLRLFPAKCGAEHANATP